MQAWRREQGGARLRRCSIFAQRQVEQDLHRRADIDRLREALDEARDAAPRVRRSGGARRR